MTGMTSRLFRHGTRIRRIFLEPSISRRQCYSLSRPTHNFPNYTAVIGALISGKKPRGSKDDTFPPVILFSTILPLQRDVKITLLSSPLSSERAKSRLQLTRRRLLRGGHICCKKHRSSSSRKRERGERVVGKNWKQGAISRSRRHS